MPIIPSTEVETTDQKIKVILNWKGTLDLLKTQETLSQKLHEINKKNTSLLELPTRSIWLQRGTVTLAT